MLADSSTLVVRSGYARLSRRRPSSILGSSDGWSGSTASFMTALVGWASGRKMPTSSEAPPAAVIVPVFMSDPSTPSMSAQQPAGTSLTSTRYRPMWSHRRETTRVEESSWSSREYASPRTFTSSPTRSVPAWTRPKQSKASQSALWYILVTWTIRSASLSHASMPGTQGSVMRPA